VAGGGWRWLGTESREQRVRREQRAESEKRESRWREMVESSLARFGKWFTEKFSVNRFPQFTKQFYGQKQIFSV
jgi:homoserine acetyltransferase